MQERLASERAAGALGDLALLLEHEPIVTLGKHCETSLGDPSFASTGQPAVPIRRVDRGGGPTYHGPGQLVLYPVVALRSAGRGVRDFVAALEQAMCAVARDLGVAAVHRPAAPGAWVRGAGIDRKLGSVGLAVRRGVTLHGAALNVTRESELGFRGFAPCGIAGAVATSLESERGRAVPNLAELAPQLAHALARRAGFARACELDSAAIAPMERTSAERPTACTDGIAPWT